MNDNPADRLALAAEFPPATCAHWRKLVDGVLKGAHIEERLQSRTADDLTIEPLYRRKPEAAPIAGRPPGARWQIMQRIDHPDPASANAQALHELANGTNGLVLVGAGAAGAHGYGLLPSPDAIERVLDGVQLDAGIALEFDLSPQTKDLPLALAALVKRRGLAPTALDIRFGFDPLGAVALNGGFPLPWAQFGPMAAQLAKNLAAQGFARALVVADGRIVHGAGGTEAQELAWVVAVAVAYLRAFEASGVALDDARRMIFFRLAADADQFLTIAKFRALRQLWARVEESCGLMPEPVFVGAETAWRTMTRDAPYENILRATIAVFAAGIGGADAITVLPFTCARGLPDEFAQRVARNTQLILLDEANIARVFDPVAGTGWAEDLSNQLCRAVWTLFQEIEGAGGAAAALEQGLIQKKVAVARAAREQALSDGKSTIVGANDFHDIDAADVPVLDVARVNVPAMPVAIPIEPLMPIRLAATFEGRTGKRGRDKMNPVPGRMGAGE
jgi:methylmalonyl-CoA mutase